MDDEQKRRAQRSWCFPSHVRSSGLAHAAALRTFRSDDVGPVLLVGFGAALVDPPQPLLQAIDESRQIGVKLAGALERVDQLLVVELALAEAT